MIVHLKTYKPQMVGRPQHHKVFPQPYAPHLIHLNLDAMGNVSPNQKFKELLFISLSLGTFMDISKVQERFEEQFGVKVAPAVIRKVQQWMLKLEANPDTKLKIKDLKWRELYEQYKSARVQFLTDFSQEPLAYPRGRFEELKKLLDAAKTPRITRVAVVKEHMLGRTGTPRFSMSGKALMLEEHIPVKEAEIQTAANILKQMGQETGTFVEKTEKKLTIAQRIIEIRESRGLSNAGLVEDADFSEINAPALPSATQVKEQ